MKQNSFILKILIAAATLLSAVSAAPAQTDNKSPKQNKPQAILVAVSSESAQNHQGKAIDNSADNTAALVTKSASGVPILKVTTLEEEALRLVNTQRGQQGLEPLKFDSELLYLARHHSENMANFNFFSHAGRDGKTVDERADAAGIKDWHSIGENIAYNSGVKNNVEFAVQTWLQSSSHKNNLLSRKWTRTGIGVAVTPGGKFYITQVFRN